MAFEEVKGSSVTFFNPKELAKGQEIVGYYTNTVANANSKYKGSCTHYFKGEDGNRLGVSGTGQLNALIKSIAPGTLTKLTYNGKKDLGKGGNPAHDFTIAVDKSNTIDVSNLVVASANTEFAPVPEASSFSDSTKGVA